jgi:SAM-dependent methyltransferase
MTAANTDQHAAWNGESGQRWVVSADHRDAVLAPIADLLLDAAAITAGERVLDIGCGCGATTLAAAAATGPTGALVGADLSAPMLDVARGRAHSHANVEYRQVDVQTDPLGGAFDVAISRFGTMFFDDPTGAFENIARHLSPGGRLCIVTWQPLEANQWLVIPGAALLGFGTLPDSADPAGPGMFAQAHPSNVHRTLGAAGFADISTEPHTLAMHLGTTITDAVDYLADSGPGRAILETIPPERHDDALAAVADALRPHHEPDHGVMLEAAVLLTTARTTP